MAEVSSTDPTRLTVAVSQAVQTLATVAVSEKALTKSAAWSAFERRRLLGSGSGRFTTGEDIDRRHPTRTTDVLQGIASVSLMADGFKTSPMNRRGVTMGGMGCAYHVGVDGHLLEGGFDINSIGPDEVFGVEVFPGPATILMEYRSARRRSGCGLIMIWTRRGT
jgi:outer membrane receptor protein involved in Fe transport